MILLQEIQCFFHSPIWGNFEQRLCSRPMKTLRGRQYYFKKLPQFTVLNTVLDPLASNTSDSLRRDSVLLHSLQRGCFTQSWCSSPMKMLRGRQYSFNQKTQFTRLNKLLDPLASNINDSLTRATVRIAILISTSKTPCSFLLLLILSLQQN
jgi:hypothetical protein